MYSVGSGSVVERMTGDRVVAALHYRFMKLHVLQLINDKLGTMRARTGQLDTIMPKRDIIAQEDTFVFFRG